MKNPEPDTPGWRVRQARVSAGLSPDEFAAAADIDRTTLVKMEINARASGRRSRAKVASALGLPYDYFWPVTDGESVSKQGVQKKFKMVKDPGAIRWLLIYENADANTRAWLNSTLVEAALSGLAQSATRKQND